MLGIGAASLTAQAIKETFEDLTNGEDFDEQEAREMVQSLVDSTNKQKVLLQKEIQVQLKKLQANSPFVSKKDYLKLVSRLEKLEKQNKKKK